MQAHPRADRLLARRMREAARPGPAHRRKCKTPRDHRVDLALLAQPLRRHEAEDSNAGRNSTGSRVTSLEGSATLVTRPGDLWSNKHYVSGAWEERRTLSTGAISWR